MSELTKNARDAYLNRLKRAEDLIKTYQEVEPGANVRADVLATPTEDGRPPIDWVIKHVQEATGAVHALLTGDGRHGNVSITSEHDDAIRIASGCLEAATRFLRDAQRMQESARHEAAERLAGRG